MILGISLVMIAGHNLLDPITPEQFGGSGWVWKILHDGGWMAFPDGAPTSGLFAAYPVVPWIGVMSLGYASGKLFQLETRAARSLVDDRRGGNLCRFYRLAAVKSLRRCIPHGSCRNAAR